VVDVSVLSRPHINQCKSEVGQMIPPVVEKVVYTILLGLLWLLFKFLYKSIRPWIKTREEMAKERETDKEKNKAQRRRQTARYFSGFVLTCAVAFGLLMLLAVTLSPTLPETPIVRLLAGGVGALGVMGALLLIFLPAYYAVIDLIDRYQKLEDRCSSLDRRNQYLEMRCHALEDRNEKFEERLKAIELRDQGLSEEQLPIQRNLAFMDMWALQKRDYDTDLTKQAKADGGRLVGSHR